MFAPGPNLPTLTGFAATPQYLGLAPREYFDPRLTMPDEASDPNDRAAIEAQVAWLRRAGVTHLLRFEPLKSSAWPVRPVWRGVDPLLHPAWGRSPEEPLYLYCWALAAAPHSPIRKPATTSESPTIEQTK